MTYQPPQWNYQSAGNPSAPTVLFLHGFMGSSSDWCGTAEALSGDYHTISLDLPGHGQTVVSDDDDYTMEQCADNIIELLRELDVPRTHLVGYSMGGRLAFYLAVHYPKFWDRVIIESASPGLKTEKERSARIEHDAKIIEDLLDTPVSDFLARWYDQPLFKTMDKSSPAFQKMMERRLLSDPRLLAKSLYNMGTGVQPSLWPHLGKIESHLLLIVGEQDTKFRNIAGEITTARPATKTAIVSNTGHNVHFENPKEYIKQVRLFLKP